jgi:hypothetical protein
MLEDQQRQQRWQPQPGQGQQAPYQPRIRGRQQQQQQAGADPQNGQQDTMGDIQEQFAKIADSALLSSPLETVLKMLRSGEEDIQLYIQQGQSQGTRI